MLEFLRIPYTGSGILSSAIGMNKAIQKVIMKNAGFDVPRFISINRDEWFNASSKENILKHATAEIRLPFVIKSANQGSSIGVSVLQSNNVQEFTDAVNKSFFVRIIYQNQWEAMNFDKRVQYIRELCDIREGIGIPVKVGNRIIYQIGRAHV